MKSQAQAANDPATTSRTVRAVILAFSIATVLLAVTQSGSLEQWIAGLPYSAASEEALNRVRAAHVALDQLGVTRPADTIHDWITQLRNLRFPGG